MGIELPAELAEVAAKAGVSWPQADEDALRASATAWREAGAKLSTLAGESDGSASKALAAMSGSAGDAARGHWGKFTAPDGTLNSVVRGCHAAADRLDHAAEQVGAAKVELVRELVNLAKNNDAAQQAAGAGHPTALLGLDAAVRGAAANVAHLTDTLTSAVRLDSGVQIGGQQPPVNANPGVHAPGDVGSAPAGDQPGGGQPGGGQSGGGQQSGGQQSGGLLGGLLGGGPAGGGQGQGGGLVDGLLGGVTGDGGAAATGGAAAGGAGAAAGGGSGQAPGLVGGLVGAVTDTVGAVAQPVVGAVGAVVPPVAAVVEPVLDTAGDVVQGAGDAVDNTVGRTVQGVADTVQGVTEGVAPGRDSGPGHDNGPGHGGTPPGQGGAPSGQGPRIVGDLLNPVLGAVPAAAATVEDVVTRTEGTVNQSSAALLDRPLLHTEAPHAPAQPATPVSNQPTSQGPGFGSPSLGSPSLGGGPAPAAPAAAAASVVQNPAANPAANAAANAAANTQAPGQQAGQQAGQKAEARAAQAVQAQSQSGQPQSGQAQPGQPQSGQNQQGQGAGGQAKDAGAAQAKAEGQAKVDGQAKAEAKDVLAAVAQQVKDSALGLAILPVPIGVPAGARDTTSTGFPLQPGPTAGTPTAGTPTAGTHEPADTRQSPPVQAAQTAQPTTEAAALFLLHMFPGGKLPQPSAEPARQLLPPSEDESFAAGLRFEPQGHPDGHLVDASAKFGLDLLVTGQEGLRSRLSGADPSEASTTASTTAVTTGPTTASTTAVSTDPVPARNRPRVVLTPGTAPDPELLDGYDPLAGMHERDWERRFLVRADPPEYAWPPGELFPEGGYEAGQAGSLAVGVELDRFGGPEGRVLSQLGTAYPARSLPPALVDSGYHRYRVAKVLPVWFTLSAEWFGQPGGGVRYRATYPVADLIALGYLEEMG